MQQKRNRHTNAYEYKYVYINVYVFVCCISIKSVMTVMPQCKITNLNGCVSKTKR